MKSISEELQSLDDHLKLKNYSVATRKSYGCALKQFLHWRIKQGFLTPLDQSQARRYILYRYDQDLKWQTINGDYSALLHYYRDVKKLSWDVEHIPRPRKERQLPRIISKQAVEKMISHAPNLKHQAFLCLLYGTGIRLSEALNLKITDIDGQRKQIFIRGKGAKDRYVDLPECLLLLLRHYYKMYRPITYLFNGAVRGEQLAHRSAQHLIQQIRKAANIQKTVSPHTFRHCYATHHLENGTDLLYLQKQLGHKQLKTTARYIHLVKTYSWRIHHPIATLQISYHNRIA
ncbi:MAG: tyrosine-type recombinase/integrase [Chitinophagales bacterium]